MKGFIKVHNRNGEEVLINILTIERVYKDQYQCLNSLIVCAGSAIGVTETVQQIEEMIREASK